MQIELLQIAIFLLRSCKTQSSQDVSHQDSAQREHYLEIENEKFLNKHKRNNGPYNFHRSHHTKSASDERGNCKCSCKNCEKPKRCCRRVCNRCRIQSPQPAPQQVPSSLVMIPYPVPFFVYPIQNTTNSTNQTTTTTTTTEEPVTYEIDHQRESWEFLPDDSTRSTMIYLDTEYYKRNAKYVDHPRCPHLAQCFRDSMEFEEYKSYYKSKPLDKKRRELEIMHNIRPTIDIRDTRSKDPVRKLPKYGLVSIPDFVSEKLMKQLRNT